MKPRPTRTRSISNPASTHSSTFRSEGVEADTGVSGACWIFEAKTSVEESLYRAGFQAYKNGLYLFLVREIDGSRTW